MSKFVLLLVGAASLAVARPASADQFNAVVTKLANTINGSAQIDVSIDTAAGAGAPIDVTVFRADGTQNSFQILTNDKGFATTASVRDLFVAAAGQDAVVFIRTPSGIEASNAILRQKIGSQKIVLGIPPATRSGAPLGASTRFSIAVGDLMRSTFLLIANVTDGQPADVGVFAGSTVFPARFSNHELGVRKVWRVPLTSAESQTHLIVTSSVPVIVQLGIDDGKIDEATVVGE